jgi:hypothetical protein
MALSAVPLQMRSYLLVSACLWPLQYTTAVAQAAISYESMVLSDGAGPYYRLDEAGGTIAFDASAAGHTATYVSHGRLQFSQPGLLSKENDAAVMVSGAGVELPATTSPVTESIEGWFRPTDNVDARPLVVRVDAAGAWQRMLWITAGWPVVNKFAYSFIVASTQYNVVGTTTVMPNRTYYVVVTLNLTGNTSVVRLYVNGVQEASLDVPGIPLNANHWQIGLQGGGGLGDFIGVMDEVAFYSSILSPAQISNHYFAGGPVPIPTPSPTPVATNTLNPLTPTSTPTPTPTYSAYEGAVLSDGAGPYYRVNEPGGTTAFDSSATGIDATYVSPARVSYLQPGLLPLGNDPAVFLSDTGIEMPATASPVTETIEGWFRPTAAVDADALIVRIDSEGAWQRMLWITADWPAHNRFAYSFFIVGTQYNVVGTTVAVPNRTYHVAVTLSVRSNRSVVRLYVDGVEEAMLDASGTPVDADHWQIGLEGGGALRNFVGMMDEVAFYSAILSPMQISTHYLLAQGVATPTRAPTNCPTATATATNTIPTPASAHGTQARRSVMHEGCTILSDGTTPAEPWPLLAGCILVLVRRRVSEAALPTDSDSRTDNKPKFSADKALHLLSLVSPVSFGKS